MAEVEYLDPSIANEGLSANNWAPGAWANSASQSDDEWQPDMEPPHINDYAAFKKHKHYGQYFRPHRYRAFPAWVYHKTLEPKLIDVRHRDGTVDEDGCKRAVMQLGPEWSPTPNKPRIDMTGKSLPVKSETQRLAEIVAQALAVKGTGTGAVDQNVIGGIVAAVMAAQAAAAKAAEPVKAEAAPVVTRSADEDLERRAMLEMAEKDGIEIDPALTNDEIKKALGL